MTRTNNERFEDGPPNEGKRFVPVDDSRTPVRPMHRPAPVVVRAGHAPPEPLPGPAPRTTPLNVQRVNPLAALGMRRATPPGPGPMAAPDPFPSEEAPTPALSHPAHEMARLQRLYLACDAESRRRIMAFALSLRPDVSGKERTT